MFLLRGSSADLRQEWTRRDCLRIGLGGAFGLLGGQVRADAPAAPRRGSFGQAKSCILIYLFGGPSHLDIWDLKPDAPPEIRGEFKPADTNVPGVRITEHLPRLARHADKYAIIRSLTHRTTTAPEGDNAHGSASHAMLTGHAPRIKGEVPPRADDFPHIGAVLSRLRPSTNAVAPFVALPWAISTSTNIVPGQNGGFMGRTCDPLRLEPRDGRRLDFAPPLSDLPPGIDLDRSRGRRALQEQLEAFDPLGRHPAGTEMQELYRRAFRFMNSREASQAFHLEKEPAALRERYGLNVFGQSLLLARRLVEAGVPLVTVYWPDRKEPEAFVNNGVRDSVAVPAWDTHGWKVGVTPNFPSLRDKLLPPLDIASSALLEDLQARGLLDSTLLAWTGEFGRSPRINGDAGRDHYGNVFSAMLAGGGIRGGQVYGTSDKHAAFPADNPVTPADFAATVYHCLGIGHDAEVPDRLGRPTRVNEGQPVAALL